MKARLLLLIALILCAFIQINAHEGHKEKNQDSTATGWIVTLNKNWEQHLADDYDQKEDIVRVKVKPETENLNQEKPKVRLWARLLFTGRR